MVGMRGRKKTYRIQKRWGRERERKESIVDREMREMRMGFRERKGRNEREEPLSHLYVPSGHLEHYWIPAPIITNIAFNKTQDHKQCRIQRKRREGRGGAGRPVNGMEERGGKRLMAAGHQMIDRPRRLCKRGSEERGASTNWLPEEGRHKEERSTFSI